MDDGSGKHASTLPLDFANALVILGVEGSYKERANGAATNRRLALDMAMRLEEAERGNATEVHLRKVLADVSERVNQRRLEFKAADTFLNDWLARVEKTKSAGTYERYRGIVQNFLKSLESRAKAKLSDITVQDVQKFIETRLENGRNPSTVRTDCKILNAPFALALRQGLSLSNPVAAAEICAGGNFQRHALRAFEGGRPGGVCISVGGIAPVAGGRWRRVEAVIPDAIENCSNRARNRRVATHASPRSAFRVQLLAFIR